MNCNHVKLPGGGFAIVCGRGHPTPRCRWCVSRPGKFLCDWKLAGGKTCDKPICPEHAQEVAPNKHLCPEHQKAYAAWLAERQPKEAP